MNPEPKNHNPKLHCDIITIFPQLAENLFSESIVRRGIDKGLISVKSHDLRKYTNDKRRTVDDRPFGGGPGMLMLIEPIYRALKDLAVYPARPSTTKVVLTSAGGELWQQRTAESYATALRRLVIICGHYEGVDHRVSKYLVDHEISIGNYVLTGGELAAGVIVDSVVRLIPGVIGNPESLIEESHSTFNRSDSGVAANNKTVSTKEYPQYTRPAEFVTDEGQQWPIPEILLSGHHAAINKWRQGQQSPN